MMRIAIIAAIMLALSACGGRSVIELEPLGSEYTARRAVLEEASTWSLRGRIAIRTADDGFSANLNWAQAEDRFDIRLNGPLGVGTVLLDGDLETVRLRQKDGETEVFADPERSLSARLGWTVPVGSFRYWALGIESPNGQVASRVVADDGRLQRLEQGGWDVEFVSYQGAAGADLPRKLLADNGEVKLTVVIRQWQLSGAGND